MRVLVVGTDTSDSSASVQALRGAGHDIARCHPADAAAFPCSGLVGPGCPLEHGGADVVVIANEPGSESWAEVEITDAHDGSEDGARCALRRHLPLVTMGCSATSPLVEWASDVARSPEELPEVVERVGSAPLRRHEAAAEEMFRATLDLHGLPEVEAHVDVTRADGAVRVVLRPSVSIPPAVAEKASVRVVGALTKLDPTAARVSVAVEDPDGSALRA